MRYAPDCLKPYKPNVRSKMIGMPAYLKHYIPLAALLAVAERFAALDRAGKKTPLLPHELAYAMFFDNSTRTKSAWAGAASRLGMRLR